MTTAKVIKYDALAGAVGAAEAAATHANTAADQLVTLGLPQASLEPGGLQALVNRAGRGTAVSLTGNTLLPANGQIIITQDTEIVGTQGVRYFDASQGGTVGAGGTILRGAPGLPQLMQVRGRPQYIPEYAINVDVGSFGIRNVELVGGYDSGGNHTGAVDGIAFTATAGPMRPIVIDRLIARGFDAALRVIPRLIGPHPDGNGNTATYHTALNQVSITNSTMTGNRFSIYAEGISSVAGLILENNVIERGGSVYYGNTVAAGLHRIHNNLVELNSNALRLGCGTHGATLDIQGNQYEANTGYAMKLIGDEYWRSKGIVANNLWNFTETDTYAEASQIALMFDEPTLKLRADRVQLLPGSRYRGIEGLREMDAAWTYVTSPAVEIIGQPDRNVYLGAAGVFGSAAVNVALTPLGRVGTYAANTIQAFDIGSIPLGALVKFSMLARSRTGAPVMTGLLVADGGGGYVPVNQDLRIRLLPEWQVLTVIVRAGQAFNGGQFKLTSPDVEYSSVHVGAQGSDKLFRPYYPTGSFS